MSNVYRQTITALEQELDALHQRAGEIQKAIDIIAPMAGPEEDDDDPLTNVATSRDGKGNRATRATETEDVGAQENGRREKILAALTDGPLATRDVAKAIKVDRKLTKMVLQRMAKVGLLKGVGVGPARRWALPTSARRAL